MRSKEVGIEEARKRLGDYITAAQQGTDIILTRNGKPAARLIRYQEDTVTITMRNDDNETMTITRSGDEIRQVFTTDGVVTDDSIAYSGSDPDGWLRDRLVEYRADGWVED